MSNENWPPGTRGVHARPDLISETELQNTIIDMARVMGYLVYHSHLSRRSEPGFPDLVVLSQPPMHSRLIFIECKAEKGRLTKGRISPRTGRYLPGQEDWIHALKQCVQSEESWELGSPVEVYVWYPHDLEKINSILAGEKLI